MQRLMFLSLGVLFGVVLSALPNQTASATSSQNPASNGCPVSPHVVGYPSGGPQGNGDWYANADRTIWATFWGWDFVLRGESRKVLWYKPVEYPITVTGRRIDGTSPPLAFDISFDPRSQGPIQPSALYFPSAGCWEVIAQSGKSELDFVVLVKMTTAAAEYRATIADLKKWMGDNPDLTALQLSDSISGDVQFPGRDDWEKRLYAQREKLIVLTRNAIALLQRMVDAPTPEETDPSKIFANLNSATPALGSERMRYDQLVNEGIKKAADWKKLH